LVLFEQKYLLTIDAGPFGWHLAAMKSVSSSFRLAVMPTNVASAPAAPSVHQNLAILPVSRTGGAVGRQS